MLLPLLGACALVGPFQGPEWEPVRDLLSQDQSCRDPQCCGNLLVFCLFLIWQIRQYRYRVSRSRKRNAIKVPLKKWPVLSTRRETFFTHGKIRDMDVPVHQWTQKQRWGYRKSLRPQWATQYLLSPQNSCQDLPWVVHSSCEPMFHTSSFSSTCLLPQDNSWEVWQVPWCPTNSQGHPSLDMCQRREQQLAPSQEKLVSVEPGSLKYNSTSTALAISLPNFPLVQRSKFCLREFLPGPLNQPLEPPTKKFPDSPQDPLAPQGKIQAGGRGYSEATLQYRHKRESRREVVSEIQASGGLLSIDSGVEKDGEAKALGCGNQRLVRRETDGQTSMPDREKPDQMGTEDREQTEKSWTKTQREPGDKNPSTQALLGENQEAFRSKTDIETQTPEWGKQEDAVETLALGKNEKEAREKEEAEVQEQGWETQSWTASKKGGNSQMRNRGTQDQIGGNVGIETEAEERGSRGQIGGENGVNIRTPGRENPREVKQWDGEETRALEWEKQGWVRTQNEVQTPAAEERGRSRSENTRKTQASRKENQNPSRHEVVQVGMKTLKEIKEEDWVVIQVPWWGNQRLMLIAIDGGLEISCWGHQGQIGGDHTVGIRSLQSDRRPGGDNGTNNLTPEAETQGQLRGKTSLETYPVESKHEEKTEKEGGVDKLALGKRSQREPGGGVGVKTLRPESEHQGWLTETRGSRSTRWKSWEQDRGEKASENGALEKKTWGKARSGDGRKIQRAKRKKQRVLRKVNGKPFLLEWKTQQKFGDGDHAEIKKHRRRNLRDFTGDGGPASQASLGEDQRQTVCESDGKIQTQGQRIQSKGRDTAAEIQDVGPRRRCGAEDSDQSHIWRRGDKGQVRRKEVVRSSLQGDSSVREGPTGRKPSVAQPSFIFRHGNPRHKQPGAGIDLAPSPEEHPRPEEHLSRQGPIPARKHRGRVSGSSQRAQSGSQRSQERDQRVEPVEDPSLTCQHLHPQSKPSPSSVFPSLLCPQISQAASAPANTPVVLTTLSKQPALKKSKHLPLESLMKRRIAHLRWGLPRRILESYLLFHFLESCSLPWAGVRLLGLRTDQEHQTHQEQRRESQGSLLGPKSPGRSQSCPVTERKSSKLSTQVQALETCKPPKSIPPKKPRRIRPQGGAREPQIQEEAPKAKIPARRNPGPATESRSWCSPGQVQELSTESSRDRKMVNLGVSHVEERACSRVRASSCTEGPGHWKKSVHSTAARLSMTILSKMPWSSQLDKPQLSAPFLTLRNPTPLSKLSAPYTREDTTRVPIALERDLEGPGHCCTGVTVPKMEGYKEHEAPGNPNRVAQNPAASQKFGFMRRLRYFLRPYDLKK